MKYDHLKSFGHPVLKPVLPGDSIEDADFLNASFEPSFGLRIDEDQPEYFVLSYDFGSIPVPEITELITNKLADFIVRVECRSTFFSQTLRTESEGEIKLEGALLRDWVEVKGYIIAAKKCELSSEKINAEFGGRKFIIQPGSIIAWAPPTKYSVEKDFYKNLRSIFDYVVDDQLGMGQFRPEFDQDYVMIYAREKQIGIFRDAEATKDMQARILNSVFFPIILNMCIILRDSQEGAEQKRWAQIVLAKCAALNISLTDPYIAAQELLKRPLRSLLEPK